MIIKHPVDDDGRSAPGGVDWRDTDSYRILASAPRAAFAWEWLRRNARYRRVWADCATPPGDDARHEAVARAFGLLTLVDPWLPLPVARPLWHADVDQAVVVAEVLDADAERSEVVDLLGVASYVTLSVDARDDEHLLLSDGRRDIRIDVVRGTLLGGPALLAYRLAGLARLRAPLASLHRLTALMLSGVFPEALFPRERRAARWILELRVADALAAGASQREIARVLFPALHRADDTVYADTAVRTRVRRLVKAARSNLRDGQHLAFLETRQRAR